jgi:hypothetical protein
VRVAPEHRLARPRLPGRDALPHLDAVGNVAFAVRTRAGRAPSARARRAGVDGLVDVDGRDVATLSGGEAQRVVAGARARRAGELLLLDEPFGNVDRLTRKDLIGRLKTRLAAVAARSSSPTTRRRGRARRARPPDARRQARRRRSPAIAGRGAAGDWARDYLRRAQIAVELRRMPAGSEAQARARSLRSPSSIVPPSACAPRARSRAEAAAGLVAAEHADERLEDPLQVLARDARAGVFDDQADLAAFGDDAHVDDPPLGV